MNSLGIILPAAGSGERLGREIPKPFIEVAGDPVILHTVRRLLQFDPVAELVVACSASRMEEAERMLEPLTAENNVDIHVVEGGDSRQDSVNNALLALHSARLVAVHDAVRPFVKLDQFRKCYQKACETGGAILGVSVSDTVKVVNKNLSIRDTPDRRWLWQAQTPQIFRIEWLRKAYQQAKSENITGTDDASLVERLGYSVYVVEGSRDNFKITYPEDLERATQLLTKNS